jgi:chromosome segregation protein
MHLTRLTIAGFKSFAKKTVFDFATPVVGIVGPNGSGKSNVAEAIRFVLGEQSMKSMRGKRGEDLIWNGSTSVPRMSRGSVTIVFDNRERFLNLDFDEVTIERVVSRDGVNEYRLNGSQVRLKDVIELLAGANIGESGHHIVSQGEADKILSASVRDRREILEDALGLKIFQYKKEESLRKLERTEENMRQVEALRREVAPHLKFLKKQVEKIEKAEALKGEALSRFQTYFAREEAYLKGARATFAAEEKRLKEALTVATAAIDAAKRGLVSGAASAGIQRIVELSEELERARALRQAEGKLAAKLEGQLEALTRVSAEARVRSTDLSRIVGEAEAEFIAQQSTLADAVAFVIAFFTRLRALASVAGGDVDIGDLKKEKAVAETSERERAKDEARLTAELETIRKDLDASREKERAHERELFALTAHERDIRHEFSEAEGKSERLGLEEAEFKRDLAEAAPLIGREVLHYTHRGETSVQNRVEQEREKRELEKIKIRLEEMGSAGGEEVMKEYKDATEREAHLERELGDLEKSAASLKQLITDLEAELGSRFKDGLTSVNKEFSHLFAILFDGGTASLVVTKEVLRKPRVLELEDEVRDADEQSEEVEEEKTVEGIDIALSIPRKRIKSLTMLSGGERALTSIALIFAMSSVNPPPFLVLDETDAALDEANSRRYGDMVASLAGKSQLIVITHNRETMSRAGVLYGVTMGGDGVSKVLSVKLEEAVKVAK